MDILTCAERFVLRAKSIVMRFIKTLWAALFPKPEYPASDRDVIALIRSELENRHMISDISPADLSFGYLRRDGREQMVVFSYVCGSCRANGQYGSCRSKARGRQVYCSGAD